MTKIVRVSLGLPTLRAGPQFQNSKLVLVIGYWNLRFVCNLVLGVWDFINSSTPEQLAIFFRQSRHGRDWPGPQSQVVLSTLLLEKLQFLPTSSAVNNISEWARVVPTMGTQFFFGQPDRIHQIIQSLILQSRQSQTLSNSINHFHIFCRSRRMILV